MNNRGEVLVIGAGLAGLVAAWQAAASGQRVTVIAKGWGATHWHAGCVDVLGYYPLASEQPVASPSEAIARLVDGNPNHPYGLVGLESLNEALVAFQDLCAGAGYPLHGSLETNWLLPTAVGTFRPTCLAPETMVAGDLSHDAPMLIAGFRQLADFYPALVADNLRLQGIPAGDCLLDLPQLRQRNFNNGVILASMMEQPDFRAAVAEAIRPRIGQAERVGFPAVLGLRRAMEVKRDLEKLLERPVFEIPILPPSVPGMRLHHILLEAVQRAGRVFNGMEAIGFEGEGRRVTAVYSEAAARRQPHRCRQVVLASGGLLGGGLVADHRGQVKEVVFDLPVATPDGRDRWFKEEFLAEEGHPIFQAGVAVDDRLQPLDGSERPVFQNVLVAGTTLAFNEAIRERSFEGIALATGYRAGRLLAGDG